MLAATLAPRMPTDLASQWPGGWQVSWQVGRRCCARSGPTRTASQAARSARRSRRGRLGDRRGRHGRSPGDRAAEWVPRGGHQAARRSRGPDPSLHADRHPASACVNGGREVQPGGDEAGHLLEEDNLPGPRPDGYEGLPVGVGAAAAGLDEPASAASGSASCPGPASHRRPPRNRAPSTPGTPSRSAVRRSSPSPPRNSEAAGRPCSGPARAARPSRPAALALPGPVQGGGGRTSEPEARQRL